MPFASRKLFRFLGLLAVLCLAGSISDATAQRRGQPPRPLSIFAAASMSTALDAIAKEWATADHGQPSIVYANSAQLSRQIEHGAPADIFISADERWADHLEKQGLLRAGTRRNFVGNVLVLVAPADSTLNLTIAKDLDLLSALGRGRLAVCSIPACPGGNYAKEALTNLGVWAGVEPRLVQASNIRGALNLVARHEASLGIVYQTDANAEPNVRVVGTFPADSHSPILYPVAVLKASNNAQAQPFADFLSSPEATKILTGQGFTIIPR